MLAAVVMITAGCPRAGTDKATTATAAPSPPVWMSIKDGKLHNGLEEAPIGLYVGGDSAAGAFSPGGDIEGDGPIGGAGVPGYLDLKTGTFVKEGEPKPPPPYVEGNMTPGGFSPTSRKVQY